MSIEEGVAFLADTPYPVSSRQLYGMLTRARVPRERVGREFHYLAADIMELHRDYVDQLPATR
jgi:hypothetical protein